MNRAETNTEIQAIILENCDDATKISLGKSLAAGLDVNLKDVGLDSLKMVEVLMGIEEKLGVEIDLEEFEDMTVLSELSDFCSKARARTAD